MNIFVVDYSPHRAARALCDKHIVKMPLETAQILSTINGGPYLPTHENHPCVKWAGSTQRNYTWLAEHGLELCKEYTRRYGKVHKCEAIIVRLQAPPPSILRVGMTPFAQCMPDEYRGPSPTDAYRRYYVNDKAYMARWEHSTPPDWWFPELKKKPNDPLKEIL